jgi:hypothetical protein
MVLYARNETNKDAEVTIIAKVNGTELGRETYTIAGKVVKQPSVERGMIYVKTKTGGDLLGKDVTTESKIRIFASKATSRSDLLKGGTWSFNNGDVLYINRDENPSDVEIRGTGICTVSYIINKKIVDGTTYTFDIKK